jgi:hypothetical protein
LVLTSCADFTPPFAIQALSIKLFNVPSKSLDPRTFITFRTFSLFHAKESVAPILGTKPALNLQQKAEQTLMRSLSR